MIRFVSFLAVIFFTFTSSRFACAEPMLGLFCVLQDSAEQIASAYDRGGYSEEDSVASSLVQEQKCVRVDNPIDVSVVYHGKVIGTKIVIGVSRRAEGTPELFGVVDYPERDSSI